MILRSRAWRISYAALQIHSQRSCLSTVPSRLQAKEVQVPPAVVAPPTEHPVNKEKLTKFLRDIRVSSAWNHGQEGKPYDTTLWDPAFCRRMVEEYNLFLQQLPAHADHLLSAETVMAMLKTVTKARYPTPELARQVRTWEQIWGQHQLTPLTEHVTLRLLTANAKAGNVGRVLKLLQLRLQQQHTYKRREMIFAIQSLQVHRHGDSMSDPTRWLDALLVHMHQRQISLDTHLANLMLKTFVRPKSETHYFFKLKPNSKRIRHYRLEPPARHKGRSQFSYPLAAVFSFAESLQQGACGHEPVVWNVHTYNTLLHACVNRGSLDLARQQLDAAVALEPQTFSYNLYLQGLARYGDVGQAQEVYHELLAQPGLRPDSYTVRAIVQGLLNVGDVSGAVSAVTDFFHQHTVLPPYTMHLRIIEFALGQGLVWEAKRYVYLIQQWWHWEPQPNYHTPTQIKRMRTIQGNESLQRPALERLFRHFGYELEEDDFF